MKPAIVASPDSTMGAAKIAKAPTAAAAAQGSIEGRRRRSASAIPAIASAATTGVVRPAVASVRVRN